MITDLLYRLKGIFHSTRLSKGIMISADDMYEVIKHLEESVIKLEGADKKPQWQPTHKHYKGGLYRFLCIAKHTEAELRLAIYDDSEGRIWARPFEMFMGKVDGRRRFTPIAKEVRYEDPPVRS